MYVGLLLPNFFILYFGQKPSTRDVTSDDVKIDFSKVSLGYETWCTSTEEAINSSCKIATVLSSAAAEVNYDHAAFVQKYFSKHWTGNEMQLTANGTNNPIMLVLSDAFPAEAADMKKDFLAQNPAHVGHPGFDSLTIQHPGKLGQEAGAKKGVAKLILLCL